MTETGAPEPEVLFEERGMLGLITLNRPSALNALTWGMMRAIDHQLDAWRSDDQIAVVAIRGAGDRAFAAGGDIRWLYENGEAGSTGEKNWRFFWEEYRLNTKIKRYPKPYVGIMDGVVMGGGVGVSIHGSQRFVTERTMFAMPETGIGLFPDVGATWFLPRMPGAFGMFCGLTGARLRGRDAVELLDAAPVDASDVDALIDRLAAGQDPANAGEGAAGVGDWSAEAKYLKMEEEIAACFRGGSVEEVLAALERDGSDWATGEAKTIRSKSPSSVRLAFRQITEGASLSFEDCMRLEYRLARYCMTTPDFYEGVRAVIVDKDNAPDWSPPSLHEATDEHVERAFASLGPEELHFD